VLVTPRKTRSRGTQTQREETNEKQYTILTATPLHPHTPTHAHRCTQTMIDHSDTAHLVPHPARTSFARERIRRCRAGFFVFGSEPMPLVGFRIIGFAFPDCDGHVMRLSLQKSNEMVYCIWRNGRKKEEENTEKLRSSDGFSVWLIL
jgi:hypothetical protein